MYRVITVDENHNITHYTHVVQVKINPGKIVLDSATDYVEIDINGFEEIYIRKEGTNNAHAKKN